MLDLQLLTINRLIIHHINPRGPDKSYVAPTHGGQLAALPRSGLDMFTKRIAQALGHHSHGIQAQFDKTGPGSFFIDAVDMMDGDNPTFLATSQKVADTLAKAQQSKSLAASKLMLISGHTSIQQRPFCAVVKAELQDALAEKIEKGKTVIDYLTEIFLLRVRSCTRLVLFKRQMR